MEPILPRADETKDFAGQLHTHEAVLLPLSGLRGGVGGGKFACERHHQRDGMLGGGDRIAVRRVHHDHAGSRCRRNIDIVHADAGAAHDFQLLRRLEDVGGDLGRGADGDTVIVAHDLDQIVLLEVCDDIGLDAAFLEDRNGGGREFVGDKNFWHRINLLPVAMPSRARASALRSRTLPRSRRTRCAGPAAHSCGRRRRRRRLQLPARTRSSSPRRSVRLR